MPIQPMGFDKISFQDANPFLSGLNFAQSYSQSAQMFPEELRKAQLANALAAIQNKYAAPRAAMELSRMQAEIPHINAQTGLLNKDLQWYDPKVQSEIASRQAQAGLANSEASKNRFMVNNPAYINPQAAILARVLASQGMNGGLGSGGTNNMPVHESAFKHEAINSPNSPEDKYSPYGIKPPSTGIQTGNPILDNLYAKTFGLGPTGEAQINAYSKQLETAAKDVNDMQGKANEEAANATDTKRTLEQFNNAYDKLNTLERGTVAGRLPATSANAQLADQASAKLVTEILKQWQQGHITNTDIQLGQLTKPGRYMDKEAKEAATTFLGQVLDRNKEHQQFVNTAAQMQLNPHTVEGLWQLYNSQRPVYDWGSNTVNKSYLNSSKDYLTPQAIQSYMKQGNYTPPNHEELSKQNITKEALENGAKKLGISPKEFKQRLQKAGLL